MWWQKQSNTQPNNPVAQSDGSENLINQELLNTLEYLEQYGWNRVIEDQPQLAAQTMSNMSNSLKLYMQAIVQLHQGYSQLMSQIAAQTGRTQELINTVRQSQTKPIVIQNNGSGIKLSDLLCAGLIAWGAHSLFKGTPLPK